MPLFKNSSIHNKLVKSLNDMKPNNVIALLSSIIALQGCATNSNSNLAKETPMSGANVMAIANEYFDLKERIIQTNMSKMVFVGEKNARCGIQWNCPRYLLSVSAIDDMNNILKKYNHDCKSSAKCTEEIGQRLDRLDHDISNQYPLADFSISSKVTEDIKDYEIRLIEHENLLRKSHNTNLSKRTDFDIATARIKFMKMYVKSEISDIPVPPIEIENIIKESKEHGDNIVP